MENQSDRFVISIQAEPCRKKTRYHWMICCKSNPDELISWGHAPTQELAEAEARNEVRDLIAGITKGGRVPSSSYTAVHHC